MKTSKSLISIFHVLLIIIVLLIIAASSAYSRFSTGEGIYAKCDTKGTGATPSEGKSLLTLAARLLI